MKRLTALKSMNEGSVTALKSSKGDRRARVSNAHIYYIMHAAARGRCHVGVTNRRVLQAGRSYHAQNRLLYPFAHAHGVIINGYEQNNCYSYFSVVRANYM